MAQASREATAWMTVVARALSGVVAGGKQTQDKLNSRKWQRGGRQMTLTGCTRSGGLSAAATASNIDRVEWGGRGRVWVRDWRNKGKTRNM